MSSKRKHPVLNVAQHMMYTFRWTIFFYWVIFILIYIGIGILTNAESIVGPDFEGQEVWESTTISPSISACHWHTADPCIARKLCFQWSNEKALYWRCEFSTSPIFSHIRPYINDRVSRRAIHL